MSGRKKKQEMCEGCGYIILGRNDGGRVVRKYPAEWKDGGEVCPHGEHCDGGIKPGAAASYNLPPSERAQRLLSDVEGDEWKALTDEDIMLALSAVRWNVSRLARTWKTHRTPLNQRIIKIRGVKHPGSGHGGKRQH